MNIKIVTDTEMREIEKGIFTKVSNELSLNEIPINKVYFAKTKPNAIIPTKREEDAGRDIYTCETKTIVIEPCTTRLVDTGIAIACNKAWFPKFFDKGGMGSKGIIVGAGVGDSGYRDGYFIPLVNTNKEKWLIISSQSKEEIAKSTVFDVIRNEFNEYVSLADGVEMAHDNRYINKKNCIIKPLNKAITQFVMLPVPQLDEEEVTWEELKAIKSERGLGKLGSSGK
ncbi:deoxyuridine 5'-triphosphate nucleotidohydrolase [Clostridium sp.]|uniref:deoxyuridine 5'-triphosphate nucleotidohydrolase n=1 Tax=Clostridium sp. TaxID=1506 RepID=UPI001A596297|nr:deoxyuridine 5'-triphosphate nucleotidohydrolase [Clostridium sp.]MBK5243184.1 deoxyuridine 5'-triphosphate nucleotidohydrolase [Clostridium sp.]